MVDERYIWKRELDALQEGILKYEELLYLLKENEKYARIKLSGMDLVNVSA